MVSKENLMGFLAIVAGMLIFKSTTYLVVVDTFIRNNPLILIGLGFLLFFNRRKVAEKLGAK